MVFMFLKDWPRGVGNDTIWPAKPKLFTIWTCTEKVCQLQYQQIHPESQIHTTSHSERQGEPGGWKAGGQGWEGSTRAIGAGGEGWGELSRDLKENQALASRKGRGRVLQAEETVCAKAWKGKGLEMARGSAWLRCKM